MFEGRAGPLGRPVWGGRRPPGGGSSTGDVALRRPEQGRWAPRRAQRSRPTSDRFAPSQDVLEPCGWGWFVFAGFMRWRLTWVIQRQGDPFSGCLDAVASKVGKRTRLRPLDAGYDVVIFRLAERGRKIKGARISPGPVITDDNSLSLLCYALRPIRYSSAAIPAIAPTVIKPTRVSAEKGILEVRTTEDTAIVAGTTVFIIMVSFFICDVSYLVS